MTQKLVSISLLLALLRSASASPETCSADGTCAGDVTSLIQQTAEVQRHNSQPPPAKPAAAAAEPKGEQPQDALIYRTLGNAFQNMDSVQLDNLNARVKREDGCKYGADPKHDPSTGTGGGCVSGDSNMNSVFSNLGFAKEQKKGASFLQGGARTVIFSQDDHELMPLHTRLRWERQRRVLPMEASTDLFTITDNTGSEVPPSEEPLNLLQEQFPLAIQIHMDDAAGCDTNKPPGAPMKKDDVKDAAAFSLDMNAALTCQANHAAQIVDDMTKGLPAAEKTWKAAQDTFSKETKDNNKFKDDQIKTVTTAASKEEADISKKYSCGIGTKLMTFFHSDKDAEKCVADRKVAMDAADKKQVAATKTALDAVQKKKEASHDKMNDAKEAFDLYKKKIRDAKTQKFMIPIVLHMISDKVMGPLAKVQSTMACQSGIAAAMSNIQAKAEEKGLESIKDPAIKTYYVTQKLIGIFQPTLNARFNQGMAVVWGALNGAKSIVETTIVTLVGSIPFVGGVLAAVVALVFDAIWTLMTNAINQALTHLLDSLVNKVVTAMVAPLMKDLDAPATKGKNNKSLMAGALAAGKGMLDTATKTIAAEGAKATAAAKGGEASVTDFMKGLSDDNAKDNADKDKALQQQYAADKSFFLAEISAHIAMLETGDITQ